MIISIHSNEDECGLRSDGVETGYNHFLGDVRHHRNSSISRMNLCLIITERMCMCTKKTVLTSYKEKNDGRVNKVHRTKNYHYLEHT